MTAEVFHEVIFHDTLHSCLYILLIEVMTGFEYCAAVGMLYEGMEEDALTCINAIRRRHDGAKRNQILS